MLCNFNCTLNYLINSPLWKKCVKKTRKDINIKYYLLEINILLINIIISFTLLNMHYDKIYLFK